MRSRLFAVTWATVAIVATSAAGSLGAQGVSPRCPAGNSVAGIPDAAMAAQDACQKSIDIFNYLAPQLGVVIAGGNATIGQGGTLGGLGHFMISARATLISADIPRVDQVTPAVDGAHSDQYPTQSQFAGVPQADLSVGIFKGIPVGITNVGGLDLLVSASYLPSFNASGVRFHTDGGSIKFGAGARLGIMQEGLILPGIAVTYLHRALPTVDVQAATGEDTLRVDNVNVSTDSWRVVASKSFLGFGLVVGAGQDRYDSDAEVSAYVSSPLIAAPVRAGPIAMQQKITRTTYFADGTLNLVLFKLIGEIGHTSDANVATYNTFAGSEPGAGRLFGAVGVRFGI